MFSFLHTIDNWLASRYPLLRSLFPAPLLLGITFLLLLNFLVIELLPIRTNSVPEVANWVGVELLFVILGLFWWLYKVKTQRVELFFGQLNRLQEISRQVLLFTFLLLALLVPYSAGYFLNKRLQKSFTLQQMAQDLYDLKHPSRIKGFSSLYPDPDMYPYLPRPLLLANSDKEALERFHSVANRYQKTAISMQEIQAAMISEEAWTAFQGKIDNENVNRVMRAWEMEARPLVPESGRLYLLFCLVLGFALVYSFLILQPLKCLGSLLVGTLLASVYAGFAAGLSLVIGFSTWMTAAKISLDFLPMGFALLGILILVLAYFMRKNATQFYLTSLYFSLMVGTIYMFALGSYNEGENRTAYLAFIVAIVAQLWLPYQILRKEDARRS